MSSSTRESECLEMGGRGERKQWGDAAPGSLWPPRRRLQVKDLMVPFHLD